MSCLRYGGDPMDVCGATLAQVQQAYPLAAVLLKLALVSSVMAVLGLCAAVTLVAWRRRESARRRAPAVPRPPVRYARGVAPARRHEAYTRARGRVYPAVCSTTTVDLRRLDSGADDQESACTGR